MSQSQKNKQTDHHAGADVNGKMQHALQMMLSPFGLIISKAIDGKLHSQMAHPKVMSTTCLARRDLHWDILRFASMLPKVA